MMKLTSNSIVRFIFFILSLIATFSIVFHTQLLTGFDFVTGSRFDGMIETSILHHWYNVLTGHAKWNQVAYFYPYKDTLGYNDGYLIFGIIYAIYKLLGFDVFLASELVNVSIKSLGFLSFFYLTHHVLKLGFYTSLAGSIIFTLSNSLTVQMHHAQLLSLAFAPLLTALLLKYFSALTLGDRKGAIINGSCAAIFLSTWLITTFYMAWFYLLFALFFIFIFFSSVIFNKDARRKLFGNLELYSIFVPVVSFIGSLIPFLIVYLPKAKETGGQNLDSVTYYAPKIGNLLDPGSTNFVFGNIADVLFTRLFSSVQRVGELNVGFPPFILMVFIVASCSFLFIKKKDISAKLIASLILALFISFAVMIKQGDFFLWEYIWKFVPGAKGMRVTSRYALFLIFPLALLATLFISGRIVRIAKPLAFLFSILLITEQINISHSANFDRKNNLAFLKSLPVPPAECKSFYVLGQRKGEFDVDSDKIDINLYPHNVDAMFIAEIFHLRTINGYSTFNPKDWDFAKNPLNTYLPRVLKYADAHSIRQGLCEFDLNTLKWSYFTGPLVPGVSAKIKGGLSLKLKSFLLPVDATSGQTLMVTIVNESDLAVGKNTYYPLNVGVQLLGPGNKVINQDFLRVTMPHLNAHGGQADLIIKLPAKINQGESILIIPVEEGITWLDSKGIKPLRISF